MALKPGDQKNFETLKRAFADGSVALMECTEKETGEYVAVICAVRKDGEVMEMVPFARFAKENPYEEWVPPQPQPDPSNPV